MIDIAINEVITLYEFKNNTSDWNPYIKNIDTDNILYMDSSKLLLYNESINSIDLDRYDYDNFIRVGNICILNSRDILGDKFNIIGLSEKNKELHKDFILDLIYKILLLVSDNKIDIAVNTINDIYDKYIHLELYPGYYREFNPQSKYKISSINYFYYSDLKDPDVKSIDISYNERVIRYLYSLIWGLYKKV